MDPREGFLDELRRTLQARVAGRPQETAEDMLPPDVRESWVNSKRIRFNAEENEYDLPD